MQVQQATYANPDLPVQEDLLITIEKICETMTTSVTRKKKLPLRCPACDAPLRVIKK